MQESTHTNARINPCLFSPPLAPPCTLLFSRAARLAMTILPASCPSRAATTSAPPQTACNGAWGGDSLCIGAVTDSDSSVDLSLPRDPPDGTIQGLIRELFRAGRQPSCTSHFSLPTQKCKKYRQALPESPARRFRKCHAVAETEENEEDGPSGKRPGYPQSSGTIMLPGRRNGRARCASISSTEYSMAPSKPLLRGKL